MTWESVETDMEVLNSDLGVCKDWKYETSHLKVFEFDNLDVSKEWLGIL